MASSRVRGGGVSLPGRRAPKRQSEPTILAKLTNSGVASKGKQAAFDTKKLLRSAGKAAWIAGTTFLILVVPLIIEMDGERQFNELELQQQSLLGVWPVGPPPLAK